MHSRRQDWKIVEREFTVSWWGVAILKVLCRSVPSLPLVITALRYTKTRLRRISARHTRRHPHGQPVSYTIARRLRDECTAHVSSTCEQRDEGVRMSMAYKSKGLTG